MSEGQHRSTMLREHSCFKRVLSWDDFLGSPPRFWNADFGSFWNVRNGSYRNVAVVIHCDLPCNDPFYVVQNDPGAPPWPSFRFSGSFPAGISSTGMFTLSIMACSSLPQTGPNLPSPQVMLFQNPNIYGNPTKKYEDRQYPMV